jgi:hypothetical protein
MSGRVLRIKEESISQNLQSPPGSSLTVVGGLCQATSPGSIFRDIFSWGQCVAQSQGELKSDGSHVTSLTVSIQNVKAANGENVFTAGQLKLSMLSVHPQLGQPTIAPTEVVFGGDAGLTLNRQKITLATDIDDFRKLSTMERFDAEFRGNEAVFKKYKDRFLTREKKAPAFKDPIPRVSGGYAICSFVSSIKWGTKKFEGNVLPLEGFGRIHFGEVVMNEYTRRFTLVRLQMGSDVQAEVAFAESDSNGSWIP